MQALQLKSDPKCGGALELDEDSRLRIRFDAMRSRKSPGNCIAPVSAVPVAKTSVLHVA